MLHPAAPCRKIPQLKNRTKARKNRVTRNAPVRAQRGKIPLWMQTTNKTSLFIQGAVIPASAVVSRLSILRAIGCTAMRAVDLVGRHIVHIDRDA